MDPTKVNGGLPSNVAQMVRNAARKDAPNIVKIEIFYDLETGQCRVGAPADYVMFHGILEAARDTFKQMMAEAARQNAEKRIAVPD